MTSLQIDTVCMLLMEMEKYCQHAVNNLLQEHVSSILRSLILDRYSIRCSIQSLLFPTHLQLLEIAKLSRDKYYRFNSSEVKSAGSSLLVEDDTYLANNPDMSISVRTQPQLLLCCLQCC